MKSSGVTFAPVPVQEGQPVIYISRVISSAESVRTLSPPSARFSNPRQFHAQSHAGMNQLSFRTRRAACTVTSSEKSIQACQHGSRCVIYIAGNILNFAGYKVRALPRGAVQMNNCVGTLRSLMLC